MTLPAGVAGAEPHANGVGCGVADVSGVADDDGPGVPDDGAGEPLELGCGVSVEHVVTVPPSVETGRVLPYVSGRPSRRLASVTPVGSPRAAVPQPMALNVTSRKAASPAGTESGGRNAPATPTSLPVRLAAVIAVGLAPKIDAPS